MPSRLCVQCNRPLILVDGIERCPRCGPIASPLLLQVDRAVTPSPTDVRNQLALGWRILLLIFAGLFVFVPLTQLFGVNVFKKIPDVAPVVRKADTLKGLGDLATEITPIEAKDLGPLDRFDPLAHLPWFFDLARTWTPDARLVDIELHGVRPDGTIDASRDQEDRYVRIQFASASRNAAAKQARKVSDSLLWSAVSIEVHGTVRAVLVNNTSEDRPPSGVVFGCSVSKLIQQWRAKGLPERDTYAIELADTHGPKEDLVWQSRDWGVPKAGLDCRLR